MCNLTKIQENLWHMDKRKRKCEKENEEFLQECKGFYSLLKGNMVYSLQTLTIPAERL